jgi:hypothetical protein
VEPPYNDLPTDPMRHGDPPEVDVHSLHVNEHPVERGVRVVLGCGLLALMAVGPMPGWGLVGLVGLGPLATAAIGTCPIYMALGISTAPSTESL